VKQIFIILIFISTLSLYGQNQYQSTDNELSSYRQNLKDGYSWRKREILYDNIQLEITKEKLLSTIWVTDPLEKTQHILVFYSDDVFKIGTRQAGVDITGRYKVQNGSVLLYDYNSTSKYFSQTGLVDTNSTSCSFLINLDHLIYRDSILLDSKKYYAVGSEHTDGTELVFNKIKVIVNVDTKVMNENMNFREKPSTRGELIKVYQYSEVSSKEITSLIKGTIVYILAKTDKQETIDGITSSWYFIKVYDGNEWYQYGWVFGGCFTNYNQSKIDEYWKIILKELSN
jgi:hypothetical protein